MTVDCQWIEKNLEAFSCDALKDEEQRLVRAHIENCPSCSNEIAALNAVDSVVKVHFRREMAAARRPQSVNKVRIAAFTTAVAAAAIAVLFAIVLRAPQAVVISPENPTQQASGPVAPPQTPSPIKENEGVAATRTKPEPQPPAVLDRTPAQVPPVLPNAPDFLVADPAGYSHSIEEYRGHVVVIAVWNSDQSDVIANIERLYKAYSANPKVRLLGVANDRQAKPANTTFPVLYNQGSKLFGTRPGDFLLLNENGTAELHGSLVNDFENLRRALQTTN